MSPQNSSATSWRPGPSRVVSHARIPQHTQLLGNVRLALTLGAYASLSDNAVVISDVTSALLGTRPEETTFSSMTNPGVVRMS